jgi:hypothetical protein
MNGRVLKIITAIGAVSVVAAWALQGSAAEPVKLPSKSAKSCLKCHKYDKMPNLFAGRMVDVSRKAKTAQVRVGKGTEIVYFDDSTVVKNASTMKKIKPNQAVRITYYKKDGKNFAKEVEVKKGLEVPKEKLASVEEVAKLVALGPEKGKYVLIDSRPMNRYDEGHIPTAENMLFFAFDKVKDKILPKDKEIIQIYYCGGFT